MVITSDFDSDNLSSILSGTFAFDCSLSSDYFVFWKINDGGLFVLIAVVSIW